MLKHALPKAAWKKASIPLEGILANESIERYEYYATDIKILISGKLFTLDKVWQSTTKGNPDLLLGNTFNIPPLLKLNIPFNLPQATALSQLTKFVRPMLTPSIPPILRPNANSDHQSPPRSLVDPNLFQ